MWRCEGCQRHVLMVSPICPFCSQSRLAAFGLALVAPVVLSACYGAPPCDPKTDLVDSDGDGYSTTTAYCYTSAELDCDDSDPAVFPGAEEICDDGIDNNCDGISAGATSDEYCGNGLDDDCDGEVDEVDCVTSYYSTPTTPTSTGDTAGTSGATGGTGATGGSTSTAATGSLSVSYTWSAGVPITSCAAAGVTLLDGTLDEVGPVAPTVTGYPCDDLPIALSGLEAGSYAISFTAQSADGIRTWDSGPVVVDVTGEVTTPVAVELTCSSFVTGGCDTY